MIQRQAWNVNPGSPRTLRDDHTRAGPRKFRLNTSRSRFPKVLVSEDGTLVALIDWDQIQTVPLCIGYGRYPSWITRDWDPVKYGYQVQGCCPENSPEELEYFRKIYAAHISPLLSEFFDYSTKSHLFEAVWIAAGSPICLDNIVVKIFDYLDLKDCDGDELCLYETAVDLAEGKLGDEVESRLVVAFQDLFRVE